MNASNPSVSNPSVSNLVVLQGHVSSEPRHRDLPSGTTLLQIEVTTAGDGGLLSVPVVWFDPARDFESADEVTVLGHVRRRFYRTGGVTQSRTEVVAECIVATSRRRDVQRMMRRAVTALGGSAT
jgi:single-strand DNA-binding protein